MADSPEYDWEDRGSPCPNYELCQNFAVPGIGSPFCMTCGSWFKVGGFGWNCLEFRNTEEACVVCFQHKGRELHFPTKCGHWFCISCCREILFWDETRYHIDPVEFGCPPCFHQNDTTPSCKSRPCEESDDSIVESWKSSQPQEWSTWNTIENQSVDRGMYDTSIASGKCPMCRKKYTRSNSAEARQSFMERGGL